MTTEPAALGDDVYTVEKILQKRIRKGIVQYFVKWRDWGEDHCSWEPKKNFIDTTLIKAYEANEREKSSQPKKRGPKPKRGRPSKLDKMKSREMSKSPSPVQNSSPESSETEESSSDDDEVVAEILPNSPLRKKVKNFDKEMLKRKAEVINSIFLCPLNKKKRDSTADSSSQFVCNSGVPKLSEIRESGRTGVTIITSPKTSPVPATVTLPKPEPAIKSLYSDDMTPLSKRSSALLSHPSCQEKLQTKKQIEIEEEEYDIEESDNSNNNAPPAEYWISKQPVADQIVITDVMVNLMPVTIRECSTQSGFFKDRENGEKTSS